VTIHIPFTLNADIISRAVGPIAVRKNLVITVQTNQRRLIRILANVETVRMVHQILSVRDSVRDGMRWRIIAHRVEVVLRIS
jgi:hypothetical protein